eukprot:TRINITY_DN64189_c0_g1_i1.p1 TRINITY_DN64189_c0_g1~~TRINITY_DN64189_c0_g1_i1.p1  ORF type:complete len:167 (+),score=32.42 TRINITY_DN64189_c0_g1_i1:37-501(+)
MTSQAGARGKAMWWRLERQFLEHRLSLSPDLAAVSPTTILAPVPSENYLRNLMSRGFPPPAAHWGAAGASTTGTASLSLADPELFAQRVHGRRVAVLGLYLPPSSSASSEPSEPAVVAEAVRREEAQAWAYLRGEQRLEVASNQQLLPLFVIEI